MLLLNWPYIAVLLLAVPSLGRGARSALGSSQHPLSTALAWVLDGNVGLAMLLNRVMVLLLVAMNVIPPWDSPHPGSRLFRQDEGRAAQLFVLAVVLESFDVRACQAAVAVIASLLVPAWYLLQVAHPELLGLDDAALAHALPNALGVGAMAAAPHVCLGLYERLGRRKALTGKQDTKRL